MADDPSTHAARIEELETEVERLNRVLAEERARYSFVMEAAELGDWDMDIRTNRTHRSLRHDQLFGYQELLPEWGYDHFLAHIHPEDRGRVHEAYQSALGGDGSYDVEFRGRQTDGTYRWIWSVGRFILDESGAPERAAGVMADVTDIKLTQQRIADLSREESVGRLAAGIAHDFNNQLTVLIGTLDAMLSDDRMPGLFHDDLDYLLQDAERSARTIRQLLTLARHAPGETRVLELGTWLRSHDSALRHLVGPRVAVRFHTPESGVHVEADPVRLENAVFNLAANARDAMPTGGTLRIRLEPGEEAAILHFADDGIGMNAETLSRCTEPFFTTKPIGRGTGLGLAGVRTAAEDLGGALDVESELHGGTTVRLTIPTRDAADQPDAPPASARTRDTERRSREGVLTGLRILLVDDDPGVGKLCRRVLIEAGAEVRLADRGEQAVAMVHDDAEPEFDVLVTDVVMPTMSGRALAEAVREHSPGTGVLLMSGYTDEDLAAYGVGKGAWRFLSKPFSPDELIEAVTGLGKV